MLQALLARFAQFQGFSFQARKRAKTEEEAEP